MSHNGDYMYTLLYSTALNATIQVLHNRRSDLTHLSPPYYHPASSITLICNAFGARGVISYYWTVTCTSSACSRRTYTTQRVNIDLLTSAYAGVYTCTVTDSTGRNISNSTEIKLKGVYQEL